MKSFFLLLIFSIVCSGFTFAQDQNPPTSQPQPKPKVKADSEIIRELKATIRNNTFLDFREKAQALKPIKMETLKTHKVYKDLIDIVKNEKINSLAREIAIELLLYFKAESHEVLGLEGELISVLQNENSGWYIKTVIIRELPNAISADDSVNMNRLRGVLKTILNIKKISTEETKKLNNLKRAVIGVLEKMGFLYADVKNIIEPIVKDNSSDLKSAALQFLMDYSISHKDFNDPEIKRTCQSIFKSTNNDFSEMDIANTITLYANLLSNEEPFHLQGSDEEIFWKFLKSESSLIVIAAANSLYKIKSMNSVEKIIERLKEETKSMEVREALIDALIYLEYNLIYSESELSPSKKKEALILIRDTFITFLSHPSVKGVLQSKLLDAMNYFVIDKDATEYLNLDSLKKLISLIPNVQEEAVKASIGKLLGNLTTEGYGTNVDLWVRWVKAEEKKPNSKWLK